ncbi:Hypothetical predicted protein [Cloeon dipterum]|uniref:RING-type domain-containing protein n=1 Tax=Cloeon dipterum TaxID=197152 RepID=A0A8S1DPQ7_9INSE|nr:Hypothetical predicted protein [Cloeon dipterum]
MKMEEISCGPLVQQQLNKFKASSLSSRAAVLARSGSFGSCLEQALVDAEVFKCDFCHLHYNLYTRRAKLLSCNHSFCLKCLQGLQISREIVCPSCQYKTNVGPTGVVSLRDNGFILPRLKDVPKEEILASDKDLDSFIDMSDFNESYLSNGSSSNNMIVQRPNMKRPMWFCRSCNKPAHTNCIESHDLCQYEIRVREMEEELAKMQRLVCGRASRAMHVSDQLHMLTVAMEDAWEALKINLLQMQKEYKDQLKSISESKAHLEMTIGQKEKWGIAEARAGSPALLQEKINRLQEHVETLEYKSRIFEDAKAQWTVFTNCTAQIKLKEMSTAFPLGNFDINLDLHEQNASPECLCMMYSIYKYVENRLQTKRMDSMLGDVNAFGSNTVKDIAVNHHSAAPVERNNNENGYQLQVVDSKPKATIAQIVATTAAAAPAQPPPKAVASIPKPLAKTKVIMEVYFSKAPIMARNFIELCTGVHGITYKYTDLWQVPDNDHVVGGNLRDGDKISIYDRKVFNGDASPLHDGVGMLRMRGHGTTAKGEAVVGSQFMIWMKQKTFKNYARTLVFGKVINGMEVLQKVPTMVNKKEGQVTKRIIPCRIMDCGTCDGPR